MKNNQTLIRTYVEKVWNQGDLTSLMSLTSSSYIYWIGGQPPRDQAGMAQFITQTHTVFADWQIEIVEMVAEGDKVVIRWEGQATHQGIFHGVAPTGKRIAISGINIYQIEEGKIVSEREQTDTIGMLLQIGIV